MSREASKRAASDLEGVSCAVAALPASREDGVRKLVTLRKKASLASLAVTMPMVLLEGTSRERRRPVVVAGGRVDVSLAEDVLQRGDDDVRARGGDLVEELVRCGREDDGGVEVGGIAHEVGDADGEQRALGEFRPAGRRSPVFVDFDEQAAVEKAVRLGLERHADFVQPGGGFDEPARLEEGDVAIDEGEVVALGILAGRHAGDEISVGSPRKISLALARGVPRFHSFTMKG